MEIEVKIRGLMMELQQRDADHQPQRLNSETIASHWVGAYEAKTIALEIEKIAPHGR